MGVSQGNPVWSGPIPSPLQGVTVSAKVNKDDRTGIFTYQYRVFNPVTNDGQIWHLDIELSRSLADAVLSRDQLVSGPRYMRHSSEDAFQRVPMVPVGISGPHGWIYGLAFDDQTPPRGFASWGAIDDPSLILPGKALEGFQSTSYGLPGIRAAQVQPDIDFDVLPDEYSDPEKARQLRDSLIFHTWTVGPKAPPQNFVPIEFLNYVITLLHDSRQLGWVREAEEHQKLLKQILKAKRQLEANEPAKAAKGLKKFLKTVQKEGCQDFRCPKGKALTSEAYALLYFNGQYLWERIPKPPHEREDDDRDHDENDD
jgi:hypothetical protein